LSANGPIAIAGTATNITKEAISFSLPCEIKYYVQLRVKLNCKGQNRAESSYFDDNS